MSAAILSAGLFVIAGLGTILLLVGIFTPGWRIEIDRWNEEYEGLFHREKCDSSKICEKQTHLDVYRENKRNSLDPPSLVEFRHNIKIKEEVLAVLSLATCLLGSFLSFIAIKFSGKTTSLGILIAPCYIVSACFIWPLIAEKAVRHRNSVDFAPESEYPTPYSIVLCAVGSFLLLQVGVIHLAFTIWRVTQMKKQWRVMQ